MSNQHQIQHPIIQQNLQQPIMNKNIQQPSVQQNIPPIPPLPIQPQIIYQQPIPLPIIPQNHPISNTINNTVIPNQVNFSHHPVFNQQTLISKQIINPVIASEDILKLVNEGKQIRLDFKEIKEVLYFVMYINGSGYYINSNSSPQLLEYAITQLDIISKKKVSCRCCNKQVVVCDTFKVNNEYLCCKCSSDNYDVNLLADAYDMLQEKPPSSGIFAYCGEKHCKPLSHFLILVNSKYQFNKLCKYCRLKNLYLYYRKLKEDKIFADKEKDRKKNQYRFNNYIH